jgi:hypothetical protein
MKPIMQVPRRSAVLVVLSGSVGHELVFRHVTSKVVVGQYPQMKTKISGQTKRLQKKQKDSGY